MNIFRFQKLVILNPSFVTLNEVKSLRASSVKDLKPVRDSSPPAQNDTSY